MRVVVRDVDVAFGSMVSLMVRATIAAIPALIILAVLGAVIIAFLSGIARA